MNYEHYETLLISEDIIKTDTTIDVNLEARNLIPSIVRAQDIDLQSCIGTKLFRKLQEMVYDGSIDNSENENYKFMLDVYIQPFLEEIVIANLCIELAATIANAGVIYSTDKQGTANQHYERASKDERLRLIEQHTNYANHYKNLLEKYIIKNRTFYSEYLTGTKFDELKAHTNSAADTSIWLGGTRGTKKYLNRR